MKVETIQVGSTTLSAVKEVELPTKQIRTPAKPVQAGKIRASEKVSSEARGVVEIYTKASDVKLDNSRSGWTGLSERLKMQAKSAQDGEFIVGFLEYEGTGLLSEENAEEMVILQSNHADILGTPLMYEIAQGADDGDAPSSAHARTIIENTKTYLDAVEELDIQKPIMGAIPPISADVTMELMTEFFERDLSAYCVDFNRRSIMAQSQLDHVIDPMMSMLENAGRLDSSLTYAVNAKFSRPTENGNRTPDALYGHAVGFDMVGDNHIPPRLPEEVIEELSEGPVELRLFDSGTTSVVEVHVDDLPNFLPSDSRMPMSRVQNRIDQDEDEQYRFAKLLNAELVGLHLERKVGIDPSLIYTGIESGEGAKDVDLERLENLVGSVRGN